MFHEKKPSERDPVVKLSKFKLSICGTDKIVYGDLRIATTWAEVEDGRCSDAIFD